MISTYVRRLRLAAELLALRQSRQMSSEALARSAGLPRTTVSRLENARMRPDPNDVMKLLEHLGATGDEWTNLMTIARQASERGWWESAVGGGARQALYANLEAGASTIREYQMTLLPGLLQTPEYTEARASVDRADWSTHFNPERAVEARAGRQRVLHRPDGPTYEVVIDELAVRRPATADDVLREQLISIARQSRTDSKITARVLPVDGRIAGHLVPRSGFSIYTYPDPLDPVVVAVDTVTDDLVLTKPDAVAHYLNLYERLRDAALSASQSVRFLMDAADKLPTLVTGRTA
ncbi:transcriptional regulator [Micromonospora craterilacus]|uniref:Transcriptional regulator n=1 Tax=Micromonospora craterilacus TaxID=1655439 RepID=A0A2W2EVQ5_9ACTN|nr:helix-turn-helix transcriptional regulator [Micromonospora craterilacus]PZG16538.1 transcriptional regulator [Micromonospora craterilacus]